MSQIIYLCKRGLAGGNGIAIPTDAEPTYDNVIAARILVGDCNNTLEPIVPGERRRCVGPCPEGCDLYDLAYQTPANHKESQ